MSFRGHPFFVSSFLTIAQSFFSFFLSFFLLPFFFLSNFSPSFFPFFVPPFYLLNNLSFFFVSPFQTLHNHYSFSPFHHLSLFFLYSFKSLCFNGLCPFVKNACKSIAFQKNTQQIIFITSQSKSVTGFASVNAFLLRSHMSNLKK